MQEGGSKATEADSLQERCKEGDKASQSMSNKMSDSKTGICIKSSCFILDPVIEDHVRCEESATQKTIGEVKQESEKAILEEASYLLTEPVVTSFEE